MMKLILFRYRGIQFFAIRPVLLLLLAFSSCFQGTPSETGTEILWDTYGVPHIYGKTPEDMYYGFGWAQMENHAGLILHLYGEARGRASEYWGEKYLESDNRIWLFDIPAQADKNYNRMSSGYRLYLDAFVQGINRYAMEHPEAIIEEVRQVLPVTSRDVIAHVLRVLSLEFIAYEDMNYVGRKMDNGSNAYAIAPSRSATGNAMLVANPHLPWWDFYRWFEAHLNTEDFYAYGIGLVGMPTLSMAFNDYLGWALTVNPMDGSDRYQLTLNENGYMLDDVLHDFETKTHSIRILQPGPVYRDSVITFKRSVHGPVIEVNDTTAIALRIVGLENAGIFEQYHKMAASTHIEEFEEALEMLQNPMFNIIYADAVRQYPLCIQWQCARKDYGRLCLLERNTGWIQVKPDLGPDPQLR
jgi:acyl-homoserine-lactone acylase